MLQSMMENQNQHRNTAVSSTHTKSSKHPKDIVVFGRGQRPTSWVQVFPGVVIF